MSVRVCVLHPQRSVTGPWIGEDGSHEVVHDSIFAQWTIGLGSRGRNMSGCRWRKARSSAFPEYRHCFPACLEELVINEIPVTEVIWRGRHHWEERTIRELRCWGCPGWWEWFASYEQVDARRSPPSLDARFWKSSSYDTKAEGV